MDCHDHSALWMQLPGYIAMKDQDGIYVTCNNNLAVLMQFKSPNQIQGLSDYDLADFSEENYDFHRQNDVLVLKGETVHCIHQSSFPYDGSYYYLIKKPLTSQKNKITGLVYHCTRLIQSNVMNQFIMSDENKYGLMGKQQAYYIGAVENPFHLSTRELECLFFTLRSFTAKKIAEQLGLSKRSVEFYLDNIKNKMGCSTKTELICLSIKNGYSQFIPPSILNR